MTRSKQIGNFIVCTRKFTTVSGVRFIVFCVPISVMQLFELPARGSGWGWYCGLPLQSFPSLSSACEYVSSLCVADVVSKCASIFDQPF